MTQPPAQPNYTPGQPIKPSNGLAIASLVLGIIAILFFCIRILSVPAGILAIVLAILALNQVKAGRATGGGMAKTGLVLGIVAIVTSIIVGILIRLGAVSFMNWAEKKQHEIEEQQRRQHQSTTQEIFHLSPDGIIRVGRVWPTR